MGDCRERGQEASQRVSLHFGAVETGTGPGNHDYTGRLRPRTEISPNRQASVVEIELPVPGKDR